MNNGKKNLFEHHLVKLRRKYGMEGECAYIITRWLKAGFVDYEGKQYKKIANPNDKTKNS